MLKPSSKIDALIEAQKQAGLQEAMIRQSNSLDQAAQRKLLDRLRFEEHQERMERDGLPTESKEKADKIRRQERDEQLAVNIDRHNCLKSRDDTMRKMVRFNSQELRELEYKLRSAVVGQGLQAQLHERQAKKLEEKIVEQAHLQIMLEQVKADKELDRKTKQADFEKRLALRAVLQDQMAMKTMQNHRLYEEFLREKKTIDDTIQQIYQEQLMSLREKDMAKLCYRNDLKQLAELQEALRQREKYEIEEEDKRIALYLSERNAREDARKREEKDKKGRSSHLAEQMGVKLMEDEQKRIERIELLHILRGEELEEMAAQKIRIDLERKVRQRLEAAIQLHEQRAERERRVRQEQKNDRDFRRRQMDELAERDKIEQLSNERRRLKIVEHNRIVQQLLLTKRNENAEALMRKLDEKREQERDEAKLKQIIEEERIKILQEYAINLGGKFPRGVLRESDRQQLNL